MYYMSMQEDPLKSTSNLAQREVPAGLFKKVMDGIYQAQRRRVIRYRLVLFSAGIIGSVVAFIPVFGMVQADFNGSGFFSFFSLIFSDSGVVMAYWQNFFMSLLESFPAFSVAMLLATVFLFLQSLKFLARDAKIYFSSVRLITN